VPFSDTEYALIAYVPLTTQKRDSRFLIEAPALAKGSPSYFNVQGLGAVDHHAFKQKIGDVDAKTMELIESKIAEWLGMKR
jgi:mRNA-degrading endonuclease toxin of MazEF toxin-antitoxin module